MTLFTAIKNWLHRLFGKTEEKTVQPVKTKKKLSRADRKQIEAAIARANRTDKKGKSAQDSIPYERMWPDGICRVSDSHYTKTIQFQDINYQLYYIDEMHLLLKEEQTAAYTVEIWKRFRKWGGIPTGITQNVKDLLSSREVENIFENSDFVYMLNQAGGDRQILAKQLGISTHQLSYVTHSGEGEGLLFYGSTILPFVDHFPKNTELYRIMTTKPQELKKKEDK